MFPEYRELIAKLRSKDGHFSSLFNKHNEIDQKIKNMESGVESGTGDVVENLKKEKLRIKDELYTILKKSQSE